MIPKWLGIAGRSAAKLLIFAAAYYFLGKLGYHLAVLNQGVAPVWPPAGMSLAVLLLWGRQWWPGIFIGSFLFCLDIGVLPIAAVGIALGNACGTLTLTWLLNRFAGGRQVFERSWTIGMFVLLVLVGTLVVATIGTVSACAGGLAKWDGFGSIWITWWLADLTSDVLLAPFLMIWVSQPFPQWKFRRACEGLGLFMIVCLLGLEIFCRWSSFPSMEQSKWMFILPLLWAVFRFGRHAAISLALLIFVMASWGAQHGYGSFASPNRVEAVFFLQLFVGTISMTALSLVAILAEFKRVKEIVKVSEDRYHGLAESLPDAVYVLDSQSNYLYVNETAARWIGLPAAELIGRKRADFLPQETVRRHQMLVDQVLKTGQLMITEWNVPYPSGARWVETRFFPLQSKSGSAELVIGISRDLTEQKELQRQILDISADERQRIGYDLHDGLGQHLSGIAFLTKAIEKDLAEAAPVQAAEVSKIIQLLNQAISQTRSLARLLSPVDVEAKGLPAALKNLADETGKIFGIEVFFLSGLDECRFNSRIGMAFYRIAQEAIHNAIHHGAAKRIEILLKQDEGEICLTVHDNGGGSDSLATPSAGMGLRIMQYRASSIEGRIIFKSEIGKGTIITCRVPIK